MTAAVLDIARSWLGEKENPAGSNHCGITEWYADTSGLEWTRRGNPWCDMSVSKWLSDAGLPTLYAYCPTHVNAFKAGTAGRWIGKGDPLPGDVVFFDWDGDKVADHVGLVEAVNSDGTVTTIEGNTGDAVRRQVRKRNVILGFGRPNYQPATEEDDMAQVPQKEWDALNLRVAAIQQTADRTDKALSTLLGPDEDGTDERVALFDPKNGLYAKVNNLETLVAKIAAKVGA
jgi:hypothetical protein